MRIERFENEYRFLSNFWLCKVKYDGITYPSAEHAYQAAKVENAIDRTPFLACRTPGDAKRLGRHITLRSNWGAVKLAVMREVVLEKFTANEDLCNKLLKTGEAVLVEGNWWNDTYWGVCKGIGTNHLGKILMQVRSELNSSKEG